MVRVQVEFVVVFVNDGCLWVRLLFDDWCVLISVGWV